MRFAGGAYNRASGTADAFAGLSADLVAAGYPALVSNSGDREPADEVAVFTARYRQQATGGGPFNDVRTWDGSAWGYPGVKRWVRVSSAGTVAAPGSSNHGKRRSNDLAAPYNANTSAHRAAQQLARRHNITCEGIGFTHPEWWHWTYWGPLGAIRSALAGTVSTPVQVPTTDTSALRRRREENGMYISGTTHPDVYKVDTVWSKEYPLGQARMRVCTQPEADYAKTGGLIVQGLDTTLIALAAVAGYGQPLREEKRDGLEVIMIQDGDALTYALWGPGYWDDTEGLARENAMAVANGWARVYGNAKNLTYAEWNDRKRIGLGNKAER